MHVATARRATRWLVSAIMALVVTASLAWALSLAGCSPQADRPLRIGITPWPGYEFLHLAREKGFFEAEGVAVRLVEFSSLRDERRAFQRKQIDGGALSLIEAIQVHHESGTDLQLAVVVDFSNGADVILARKDIADVKALRGRRVAVEIGSLSMYMLMRALELNGMTVDDVELVQAHHSEMHSVYHEGKVDAVVTYPPASVEMDRHGEVRSIFTSARIPGEIADVLAFDSATMQRRPEDVARVVRAYFRAVAYTRLHPQEAIGIMAARESVSPAEFQAFFDSGIHVVGRQEQAGYLRPGGRLEPVIAKVSRLLRDTGRIAGPERSATLLPGASVASPP